MTEAKKEAFGWNDTVEAAENEHSLLPEGEAYFTIRSLERKRKEFGKFGTINVAVLTIMCTPAEADGQAEIQVQLGLHVSLAWKILQLATACGFRKSGDGNQVDPRWWDRFVKEGSGRCRISHRKFAKKADKEKNLPPESWTGVSNEIAEFLAPDDGAAAKDGLQF